MLTPGPITLILGQMAGPFGFLTVTPALGAMGGGLLFALMGGALGAAAAWIIPPLGLCLMIPCGALGGSTGLMTGALCGGCLSTMLGWIPCLGALWGVLAPCGMYCDQALFGITETLEGGEILYHGLVEPIGLASMLEALLDPFSISGGLEGGVDADIADILKELL